METRPLGPGAPAVSAIGYGGMHLSVTDRPPEEQSVQVLHAVFNAGVTLIDTADVYCQSERDLGHNERLIATALRTWGGQRERIVVATKGGMTRPRGRWERDGSPEHLRKACDRSLKALSVEQIDLYQFHAPDKAVPFTESVGALADLQREGKIRWMGLSNVSVAQIREAQAIVQITSVQNRLNPFFREAIRDGVVKYCAEQGLGFLAYSPVGGGRLNRKLPDHPVLKEIAARHGASCHAVTLAWVRAQGKTVIPIPSARTVEHALDSTGSLAIQLSREELAAIDGAEFSTA